MGYINKKNKVGGVSESSPLLLEGELGIDLNAANGDVGRVWVGTGAANIALGKRTEIEAKVTSNPAITGATKTKITYDAKGLVTSGTDVTAADVVNTPAGNIVATTVQEAINALDSEKANIASPVFTGNVTGLGVATGTSFNSITGLASVAPLASGVTATVGTSTAVAREDHVHPTNFTATATDIKMNGIQDVGTLTTFPRADHVHPVDTSRAPLAPNYTGIMANITAAGTTNIGAAEADYLNVTGTTTITAFDTIAAGIERTIVFDGALTLTYNATSLILPTGANITTTAGDTAVFRSEGSGNWRLVGGTIYTRIVSGSISSSVSGIRQTVLDGLKDTNGYPACVVAATGLNMTVKGSATDPFVVTAADGYSDKGAVDYVGAFLSDQNVTLTVNATNYLYAEYDKTAGTWSLNKTTTAPTYGRTDSSTFNIAKMKMTSGNPRVYFAEAITANTIATPQMTSNTAPSGVASADSVYSTTYEPWKAFNRTADNSSDFWEAAASGLPHWLRYDFPTVQNILSYGVTPAYQYDRSPKNWTFEGSNDDTSWTVLDTQTNITSWVLLTEQIFIISAPQTFTKYRLNITANNGDANGFIIIGELKLYIDGSISSVTPYAYIGEYDSGNFATTAVLTSKNHNIGVSDVAAQLKEAGSQKAKDIALTNKTATWTGFAGTSNIKVWRTW